MNYLAVSIIIGLLILVHELGHFIAARAVGVSVEVFSIGFGPALWKKRVRGTEYRLSLVPLGGYVLPAVKDEHEYFLIPISRRIIFSMGGPMANLALIILLFGALNIVQTGFSPAGVLFQPFIQSADLIQRIFIAFINLFAKPGSISGIVGILHDGGRFIGGDGANAVRLAIIISANLAIFNLLPLPVLDGGKILFCILEKISIRLRPLFVPIMVVGWLLIIGLMIYATVMDVGRLISYS
ncbi:MAG TPA: site-2 protease family protein [Spirochaetota bacterium]|nr:site-2 protease family protein [Spirochaetota bacterium]HPC41893.1 site-2 protease family protein [Spirochaetota bacterium]HQF09604.1 site-2 protease family protein [Spirochaetota bacterium]HQH98326.1 site-2 protease family protein [Spirochaetota bacterium]HQJ71755.1 site-2 protease family protein [Spirochaetota bacterium]